MKFLGRKGQGAMEYLMTYGWAILVVMIVGVVLWQMGIFSVGGTIPARVTGFNYQKPIDATLQIMSGASNANCGAVGGSCFELYFVNGEPAKITISTVSADVLGTAIGACTPSTTQPAQGEKYSVTCVGAGTFTKTILQGDPVYGDIDIIYSLTIAGASRSRTESGRASGPAA